MRLSLRRLAGRGALPVALLAAAACDGEPTLPPLRAGDTAAAVDAAVGSYGLVSVDSVPLPITTTANVAGATITTVLLGDTLVLAADGQYRQTTVTRETQQPAGGTATTATGTAQAQGRWSRADSVVTLTAAARIGVPQDTARGPLTAAGRLTLRLGTSVRVYQR
jgi:hypothetical protein